MKKQLHIVLGGAFAIITLVAVGLIYVHNVKAQTTAASITLPARFSYAAKFVCGFEPSIAHNPPAEPPVKTGNYATVINLHNPWASTVTIQKKVALAAPETYPNTRLIDPTKRFQDNLPSDHGMSIDCTAFGPGRSICAPQLPPTEHASFRWTHWVAKTSFDPDE